MKIHKNLAQRRRELKEIQASLIRDNTKQFDVWFHDMELLDAAIREKTDEIRQCVIDINKDRKRYREIIIRAAAINVSDLSLDDLEKRSGEASRLLDMVTEIRVLAIQLPRKVEKLAFLL